MPWGGHEEWRERWDAVPAHTRRRVERAVREGRGLPSPAEASLATGLALSLLHRHRWSLLAIPWLGGFLAALAIALLGTGPAPTWALAGAVTGGVWLHRLLLAGPRLRQAYQRNLAVTRLAMRSSRRLRRAVRSR